MAAFLDAVAPAWSPESIIKALVARWPHRPKEEYLRALEIAIEVRRMTLAYGQARLSSATTALPE